MRLIHHVSENMILNQGCSQKYNNNENIHVDKTSAHHQGDLVKVFFSIILLMFSIDWFAIFINRILVIFINQF